MATIYPGSIQFSEKRGNHIADLRKSDFDSRNPNGKTLPAWPEYNQKEGYLKIGATTQAAQGLKDKEVAFWTKVWTKEAAEKPLQEKKTEL